MTALASALTFDPALHEYRLPDGRRVASVTEILRAVGVSVDFEAIGAMSSRLADQIEVRRQLGTAVHADAHAFDDDDLDWTTVDPRVEPYVRAWAACRENMRLLPTVRERVVYSAALGVCGTLDAICFRWDDCDRRILLDLKLGDPESAAARYQTALYQMLWDAEHPEQSIAERWSVQLTPERSVPYRIEKYSDWSDFATARAIVATYHVQAARRSAR